MDDWSHLTDWVHHYWEHHWSLRYRPVTDWTHHYWVPYRPGSALYWMAHWYYGMRSGPSAVAWASLVAGKVGNG